MVSKATAPGMAMTATATTLAGLTAFEHSPAAATSGKQSIPCKRDASAPLYITAVAATSTTPLSSPTRRSATQPTTQEHLLPLLASADDVDKTATEPLPEQYPVRHFSGGLHGTPAAAVAASGCLSSVAGVEVQEQGKTSPAASMHDVASLPAASYPQPEAAAPASSSPSQSPLPLFWGARSELLQRGQRPGRCCCGSCEYRSLGGAGRGYTPAASSTRPNLCSTYLRRRQAFYTKVEARYGSGERQRIIPHLRIDPPPNTASNASSSARGQDVESTSARRTRILDNSDRMRGCSRRGCNDTWARGSSSSVVDRSLSTSNANGISPDSEEACYTRSGNVAASAVGAVRRIAGGSLRRDWEDGGWVGWARGDRPCSSSGTRHTSRSCSPNRNQVSRKGHSSAISLKPCSRQKTLLTARQPAVDEATSEKVACTRSIAGRSSLRTMAVEEQKRRRKSEKRPGQEAVPLEEAEQKRQQRHNKTTKRGHLQQRKNAFSPTTKQTTNKRTRATERDSEGKRVRFTTVLPAALLGAKSGELSLSRAGPKASILGKQQKQQEDTVCLVRQSNCDRKNNTQARRAPASKARDAAESAETRTEAGRTKTGLNVAGDDGGSSSTVSTTPSQSITSAQRTSNVRRSSSIQRVHAQIPGVTALAAVTFSLEAASEPFGAAHRASGSPESPASVATHAATVEQSLYSSSVPQLGHIIAPGQAGNQLPAHFENAGIAATACVNGFSGAVAGLRQRDWPPKTAARFSATSTADEARQQHGDEQQELRDRQSAQQTHTKRLWEHYETQQWHQSEEEQVQPEQRSGTQCEALQWQLENIQCLQQKLRTLHQQSQRAEVPEEQRADQSRKQQNPHNLQEQGLEWQAMEAQHLGECEQALPFSLQEEPMRREANLIQQRLALLPGAHLSRGAAPGATNRRRRRCYISTAHSSNSVSNGSSASSAFSTQRCTNMSVAPATLSGVDPKGQWLKAPLGCNSNCNTTNNSPQAAVASSRSSSGSTKPICASAAAAAAAFNALPRARGVWFDAVRSLIRTSWKEGGRVRTAGFPVRKLGLAEARMRAIEYRLFRCPNDPLPPDLRSIVPRKNPQEYGWFK